jgi:Tectonin domain
MKTSAWNADQANGKTIFEQPSDKEVVMTNNMGINFTSSCPAPAARLMLTFDRTKDGGYKKRWPFRSRMAVATCVAVLMAATAFGQNHSSQFMEKVNATTPIHPIPSAPKKSYTAASVYASPGLECKLYPTGSAPSTGLTVYTDDDGYARFHAVRAAAGDAVHQLNMDCTDSAGHSSSYSVDLTSNDTFAPRPLNLANELGIDRPALKGDPLSYTQSELIKAGYGVRPDPKKDAAAYSRWLVAASVSGRQLTARRPTPSYSHTVYTATGRPWTGSVLTGAPLYVYTEAQFNVPFAIPGGDETGGATTGTKIAIWNGLGGFDGAGSGLIQGGVDIRTTPTLATYGTFREFCCGDNNYYANGSGFTPNAGDQIYSQQWYCDAYGNENLNGGYGCSFLEDETLGAVFSCVEANESPCSSVAALPLCSVSPGTLNCMTLGQSAEFVIENITPELAAGWNKATTYTPGQIVDYGDEPYICLGTNTNEAPPNNPASWAFYPPLTPFTDFTPQVNMQGEAFSLQKQTYEAVNLDPVVYLLTDFTNYTSHMNVSVSETSEYTYFSVSQFKQVGGAALSWNVPCAGVGGVCFPQPIAVGPNANGSAIGDPWVLGANKIGDDYGIWHWENNTWVEKPGAATQIAVSPQGVAWVIDYLGQIFYWNGSAFELAPGGGCAISIGVGPASGADPYGTPWVIGCNGGEDTNGGIYQLQGSSWVKQPGAATQIAVSPEGIPWVIAAGGYVFHWNGSNWTPVTGCATSIAVGPSTAPRAGPYGDAWAIGCGGNDIYQFQNGTFWAQIPGAASYISVSPDLGVPWVVNSSGQIFE